MRLLLIGFEALSPQLLFPRRDKLPAIEALCRKGTWGTLESYCELPLSGPAWTTLYTGLLPEEHGVTDKWGRELRGSKTFATCQAKYVWDLLAEEGFTVGLFNLPATCPPRPIPRGHSSSSLPEGQEQETCKNWMVSGPAGPEDAEPATTWPESLQGELVAERDLLKRYFSDPTQFFTIKRLDEERGKPKAWRDEKIGAWHNIQRGIGEEMVSGVIETVSRHQLQVCLRLFKNHLPDVGFCHFSFLDRVAELWGFPLDEERPDRWYRLVDEFVGTLVEQEKPENVMIVSNRGFEVFHYVQSGVIIMAGPCFGSSQNISMRIQEVSSVIRKCVGSEGSTTVDDEIASQLRALGYIE